MLQKTKTSNKILFFFTPIFACLLCWKVINPALYDYIYHYHTSEPNFLFPAGSLPEKTTVTDNTNAWTRAGVTLGIQFDAPARFSGWALNHFTESWIIKSSALQKKEKRKRQGIIKMQWWEPFPSFPTETLLWKQTSIVMRPQAINCRSVQPAFRLPWPNANDISQVLQAARPNKYGNTSIFLSDGVMTFWTKNLHFIQSHQKRMAVPKSIRHCHLPVPSQPIETVGSTKF